MIKYKKAEMLQAVTTLIRANDAISKVLKINPEGVIDTLIQSQEVAILLGTFIEENFEEKCAYLVELLENYCENLYQMSIGISDESLCQTLYEEIKVQLIQLSNGIQADVPNDRKEIVFFPYKASMWDSLESIWKAADEDENTDVYVIPIPYFDKNPDGTFKKEYYEGDLYPKYVPITKYDEYDFEKRKPDIIYIHNPYDDCNSVTSVHPMFYSRNLVKYTSKLIYIPYFVLREIEVNDQNAIDKMKHFISIPGVVYADKVIVQSENMKRIYVNEYIKWAKEQGILGKHIDRPYQESKILGIGSPKYDKVIDAKKEDFEILDSWKKILGNKKVVLFNTSINALLLDEERYLDKLEKVLCCFQKREDYVLWWRPHPLLLSTFDSIKPNLATRYREIVSWYKNMNFGIYDETADLNRAIAYSDRYYGDRSSILELYGATNKPALVSIINQREREQDEVFSWRTGDVEQGDLSDWLDGTEKWTIKGDFRKMYRGLQLDGKNGKRIHEYVMGE